MTLMRRTDKGSYAKHGTPVEFTIDRYASYSDVVEMASEVLSMQEGPL